MTGHAVLARKADTDVLRDVADSLTRLPFTAWHFGDSVAFEGLVGASEILDDDRWARFAQGFARGWAARRDEFMPLDCTAPGAALCRLAARYDDAQLADAAVQLAEFLTGRRRLEGVYRTWDHSPLREPYGGEVLSCEQTRLLADPGPGIFVDCLHFDPPLFAALFDLTNDQRWRQESLKQAHGYVAALQDDATGLFYHFHLERTGRPHVLGWGRGQGWALLGLLEVLERFPDETLRRATRRLVTALVATQRQDGHWNAVVDGTGDSVETSVATFAAIGLRRAERLGLVDGEDVRECVDRAEAAVLAATDERGHLGGVSDAVWACTSRSHYLSVPVGVLAPWGQGALALMLCERLRATAW